MPRGKNQTSVPAIFESFISSLGSLIKAKVAESVEAATSDFFATKFGEKVEKKVVKAKKNGRRGRPKGSRNKKPELAKDVKAVKAPKSVKPVKAAKVEKAVPEEKSQE